MKFTDQQLIQPVPAVPLRSRTSFVTGAITGIALALSTTSMAAAATAGSPSATLLRAIVLSMGQDAARITDVRYDRYFKEGSATAGVGAIIAAGQFSINGLPIPASAEDFWLRTPDGYRVNQVNWLSYDAATAIWKGGFHGQQTQASYGKAALAVATGIVAGLEVRLYDTDGDWFADTIEADYKEGVQVQEIIRHSDGTISVRRGDLNCAERTPEEGRHFDGPHFTTVSDERIAPDNFDPRIMPGDVALFWWGPTGWVMQRARQVYGLLVDGRDHESYIMDNTAYQDAMRFSRDNLLISNRPGEFVNAQKFFGLIGNADGLKVSLWLVPTTDLTAAGAPVGMTSGTNSRRFLAQALRQARRWLLDVVPSADGTDVATEQRWVPQLVHVQLDRAIARAQAALDAAKSTDSQLDYQIYLLYLTLNGSTDDIGARFGGYSYPGFIRAIQAGLQPTNESP